MINSLVCCFSLFCCSKGVYPSVEVQLVSAKSPGTNSPFNKIGVQKRTSYQDCYSSRGRVCLNYVRVFGSLMKRREKNVKQKKRAVLSRFSLLDNTFSCVKFIVFILGQCLNVQLLEHVIWLQKVFVF